MNNNTKSTLTQLLTSAKKENRLAKIPFITAGYPNKDSFWNIVLDLIENGCDIIEIGVPFSDPVADGEVVAQASEQAVLDGISLSYIFSGLKKYQNKLSKTGIVLMGYANPFLQYGWKTASEKTSSNNIEEITQQSLDIFLQEAKECHVSGLIIPDLPIDEYGMWKKLADKYNIDIIALVGANTSSERMQEYSKIATGYIYVVSILGTTGVQVDLATEVNNTLSRAKKAFNLPLALGFGIQNPAQLKNINKENYPDAVVFGSALLKHLKEGNSVASFMKPWLTE